MPALLISVRCERELADVLAADVDVVDFKEPSQGPLAPASVDLWNSAAIVWQSIANLNARSKLSAALGESDQAASIASKLPPCFAFAKAGPSGCDTERSLRRLWSDVRRQLDPSVALVAVAYADHREAGCLSPMEIFRLAANAGMRHCLVDTFNKNGQSTIDHLGVDGLKQIQQFIHQSDLWWALAGSMQVGDVCRLHHHDIVPNCFGVRGDVCRRDRTGQLQTEKIEKWRQALTDVSPTPPNPSLLG